MVEAEAANRAIAIADVLNVPIYVVHVSCVESAEAIARAAGPFGPFDAEMRKKADQIAMVARFKFTRDQTLETSVR